jgi:hypothetical protein
MVSDQNEQDHQPETNQPPIRLTHLTDKGG